MNRTSRLFRLMDALRGRRRPVSAARLAEELAVSVRTVYRDMQALADLGAPIEGEAGVGYLLRAGFFLPPLMFSEEELEALVLGARWVKGQGDPALARAADSALAKIATASPQDLRDKLAETGLWAPRFNGTPPMPDLALIRAAIRRERKLAISYVDAAGEQTHRTIWPVVLAFFEGVRLIGAWCELRGDFRHFRADRIVRLELTDIPYPSSRRALEKDWRRAQRLPDPA